VPGARHPGRAAVRRAVPDYHRPTDTADRIDVAGLVKVTAVAREVVAYLASRAEPLHAAAAPSAATPGPAGAPSSGSRASLGTMPDFAFAGPGVRVAQVMPGSAAEKAGLQAGDVVLAIGTTRLAGLKDLSEALKAHAPGDSVTVTVLREGREVAVPVTLQAR